MSIAKIVVEPAGNDTEIQLNNNNSFGSSSNLTFANDELLVTGLIGINMNPSTADGTLSISGDSNQRAVIQLEGTAERYVINCSATVTPTSTTATGIRMVPVLNLASNISTAYGINNNISFSSGTGNVTNAYGNWMRPTINSGYTGVITNYYGIRVDNSSVTGTGSITNYRGFQIDNEINATGTIRGFVGQINSGTDKHNLYMSGSADNYINGNVGIKTTTPTHLLDIDGDSFRLRTSKTPSSASDTGTQGQIAWDADYIYVCTATDTWKRSALTTW